MSGKLKVQKGDAVLPAFQALQERVKALDMRAGRGVKRYGQILSLDPAGNNFSHMWMPLGVAASGIRLKRGTVDGLVPKIGGIPMDGDATHTAPALPISKAGMDPTTLTSYVVLEVELEADNKTGAVTKNSRIEIVHRAQIASETPTVGAHELVLLLWSHGSVRSVVPIAMHPFSYLRTFPVDGQGNPRHFFPVS